MCEKTFKIKTIFFFKLSSYSDFRFSKLNKKPKIFSYIQLAEEKITKGRKKRQIIKKKDRKKKEQKKKHLLSDSILILKKTLFLVGLLINWCWQQTWCIYRSSFQVHFLFSLPLPLSSSSWFAIGCLSFFFLEEEFAHCCWVFIFLFG